MKILNLCAWTISIVVFSPLITGIIARVKNNLKMKRGAGVFQPYYNILKLFGKEIILPHNSSWIFKFAPYAALASSVAAAVIIAPMTSAGIQGYAGDLFALIFVLSFGRFFMALAGLDTGSPFGGMGSSREMFISSLMEPAALLALFVVSLNSHTSAAVLPYSTGIHFSSFIAGFALFIVTIAETSRLPIDNRETHLELTMIHEAMVLEYSGRNLALIELASHIKQAVFLTIVANILLPVTKTFSGPIIAGGIYALKIISLSGIVAVLEVSAAKVRLFRVVDIAAFAFVLSFMAMLVSAMGI